MVDLVGEVLTAAWNVRRSHQDWLAAHDVSPVAIYSTPPRLHGHFGVCRAQFHGDLYEPAEDGKPVILMGVNEHPDEGLSDIVAFEPSNPVRWYLRLGNAVVLGLHNARLALFNEEPVHVHATPLDWLRADCAGWENVKRWPEDRLREFDKFLLAEDDIVLAMDRTWVKAGMKYAKITENLLPCLLLQRVARLRSKDELEADFLFHLMGSKLFTDYVLSIQTGLGVPHISGKQIQSFQFAKPNVEEQKSLVEAFNATAKETQRLEAIYRQKLDAFAELKQSILQKAFSGELTREQAAA